MAARTSHGMARTLAEIRKKIKSRCKGSAELDKVIDLVIAPLIYDLFDENPYDSIQSAAYAVGEDLRSVLSKQ